MQADICSSVISMQIFIIYNPKVGIILSLISLCHTNMQNPTIVSPTA